MNGSLQNVGIHTNAPGNTLEISNGTTGNSGLRFSNLDDSFTPTYISIGKVLTVDSNGDVVLTDDQGAGSINTCGGTGNTNFLMKYHNTTGSQACNSGIFEDPSTSAVGIGISSSLLGKIHILSNTSSSINIGQYIQVDNSTYQTIGTKYKIEDFADNAFGSYVECTPKGSGSSPSAYGHTVNLSGANESNDGYYANISGAMNRNCGANLNITNANASTINIAYGAKTIVSNTYTGAGIGLYGRAEYGANAKGVYAIGNGATTSYGVFAEAAANSATTNIGVYAYADAATTSNYGMYAFAPTACTTTSGISTCTSVAGWFNGYTLASGYYTSSDLKLKTNVEDVQNTWSIINALHPKTYDYNAASFPSMNLPTGNHYGLIAQDVEAVLPNLVKDLREPEKLDTLGNVIYTAVDFKAVNYTELIPIMLKGMQEQKATIDSLLTELNGGSQRVINPQSAQKIELSDNKGIILDQNDPNPFSESTVINFSIPSTVNEAKIIFTDNKGAILRNAKIESRGEGSLEIYASELSSGIYTYTLICDGKVIESKKMMKTK